MNKRIEHLRELLIRLEDRSLRPGETLPEGVMSSSELTIAHSAREEINSLNEIEYVQAFKELLATEKVTINKINLITYLVRLADKHSINEIADYVLGLVKKEKTRWVNDVALHSLNQSNLTIEKEQEILFDLANHKDWQIRFNSLGLLSKLPKTYHKRIENLCLAQIEQYKSKHHALGVLASTLSKVGSNNCINSLKEIVRDSKKSDTILSAINAVDKINGQNELEFFLESFKSKKDSFVKGNLVRLISKTGNIEQSDLMIKRLKSILSRKRQTNWVYLNGTQPEIVTIIQFLDKNNPTVSDKILKWLTAKKMDKLDETETIWINERMKNAM